MELPTQDLINGNGKSVKAKQEAIDHVEDGNLKISILASEYKNRTYINSRPEKMVIVKRTGEIKTVFSFSAAEWDRIEKMLPSAKEKIAMWEAKLNDR